MVTLSRDLVCTNSLPKWRSAQKLFQLGWKITGNFEAREELFIVFLQTLWMKKHIKVIAKKASFVFVDATFLIYRSPLQLSSTLCAVKSKFLCFSLCYNNAQFCIQIKLSSPWVAWISSFRYFRYLYTLLYQYDEQLSDFLKKSQRCSRCI